MSLSGKRLENKILFAGKTRMKQETGRDGAGGDELDTEAGQQLDDCRVGVAIAVVLSVF